MFIFCLSFFWFFFSLEECRSHYLYITASENDFKTCPGKVGKVDELIQHVICDISGTCLVASALT